MFFLNTDDIQPGGQNKALFRNYKNSLKLFPLNAAQSHEVKVTNQDTKLKHIIKNTCDT